MSFLFCESRTEALELEALANARVPAILEELRHYVRASGEIGITVQPVWHGAFWSVEADLLFDGEVVRHYEAFDLLELELNELELAVLVRSRKGV